MDNQTENRDKAKNQDIEFSKQVILVEVQRLSAELDRLFEKIDKLRL